MNNEIKITRGSLGEDILEHESYGMASFSRVTTNRSAPLFGSSIGHSQLICLRIQKGRQYRSDSSYDRYGAKENIVEVEMSQTQFAELISTMNIGDGVPVTIRTLGSDRLQYPPVINKRNQHSDEFKQRMIEFDDKLTETQKQLKELLNKQKLSKQDKLDLKHGFERLTTEIRSNIPFFERMFQEQMDKTVSEAKGEVDAFITNAVIKTGLAELENQKNNLLLENE